MLVETSSVQLVDENLLYPEERAQIDKSVLKRRAEFGTGRVLARAALAKIGIAAGSLPSGVDGRPIWPTGVVGSVSHAGGQCAVVVANKLRVRALGLDIEQSTELPADQEALVCTARERRWLDTRTEKRGALAKLVFSCKEAFYKCQYELSGTLLDFLDVELDFDLGAGRFWVRGVNRCGGVWSEVRGARGRFASIGQMIVSGATL